MVSPSAMPVDSMQKPMALIARSSFMTVSSRKGLKTEFKNKMNIRGQYFIKLSVQTEKLKKQIDGGVIVMVSPSAMPMDSMQKPMVFIAWSNFMTVLSRKGLKTDSKNRMNIKGQYSLKLSVQTAKLNRQINGGVIVMVSPSAMLADSTQKPMALIVQSISLTVSSRKGLNTESKNRINILSQYSRKLCSTQLTDQWQSDNSGQPICNACEQYTKEYGFDPPVHLHGSVIKKRPINRTQK